MKNLVVASIGKSAGKTSIIIGLAKALDKKFAYLKPLGDRLLYRKKRLWDYDSALITNIFGLKENPDDMSIGFEHSKLHYMYDQKGIEAKLDEMRGRAAKGNDLIFIECGKTFTYGTSIYLDPISIARKMKGTLIIVLSGQEDVILDDIAFVRKYVDSTGFTLGGVIINKARDPNTLKDAYLSQIEDLGIKVLGVLPFREELTNSTVGFIADHLLAKIIAGGEGLNKQIKNIFIGAMSADAVLHKPLFNKENKLVITSGDRTDMILAAFERQAVGVVLTNNILPPPTVVSKAEELQIPLMLVPDDTFTATKKIDDMEMLLTKDDHDKIEMLGKLVKESIELDNFIG